MTEFFLQNGIRSANVHTGSTGAPRARSLEKLRDGEIDVVFAVDIFNEASTFPPSTRS
jgi:excinuclease UvrABC helicase subunit UvrB